MNAPRSLTDMQTQVDRATREQIISMLVSVVSWDVNINDTSQINRKRTAQEHIEAILLGGDAAIERARVFLHKLAGVAGAKGGW